MAARKTAQAFRTITEVADWLETPTHVLRFWESKFKEIKPIKRAGGRRYYRPEDLAVIGAIKVLLHEKGNTIAAVKDMLKTDSKALIKDNAPSMDFFTKTKAQKDSVADVVSIKDTPRVADTPQPDSLSIAISIENIPARLPAPQLSELKALYKQLITIRDRMAHNLVEA